MKHIKSTTRIASAQQGNPVRAALLKIHCGFLVGVLGLPDWGGYCLNPIEDWW